MLDELLKNLIKLCIFFLLLLITYTMSNETHSMMIGCISIIRLINLVLGILLIKSIHGIFLVMYYIIESKTRNTRLLVYTIILLFILFGIYNQDHVYILVQSFIKSVKWNLFWPFPNCQHLTKPSNGLIALYIHKKVNHIRQKYGTTQLSWDNKLAEIAYYHSSNMAKFGFFSHIDQNNNDPTQRASYFGYFCRKELGNGWLTEGISENIFMIENYDETETEKKIAEKIVAGWMNSPSHRANILDPKHDKEGIGVVVWKGKIYVTQDFC